LLTPLAIFDARPSVRGVRRWWRARRTVNEIVPGLFIGGCPRRGSPVAAALVLNRVDYVVVTTLSCPPLPLGITARHVPFLDAGLPTRMAPLVDASAQAAERIRNGGRVSINCGHGLDRSALIAALILRDLDPRLDGPSILEILREKRGGETLHNRRFARFVAELPPTRVGALRDVSTVEPSPPPVGRRALAPGRSASTTSA
jgi:hypothetical protein